MDLSESMGARRTGGRVLEEGSEDWRQWDTL